MLTRRAEENDLEVERLYRDREQMQSSAQVINVYLSINRKFMQERRPSSKRNSKASTRSST